jgi:hypothetical protein
VDVEWRPRRQSMSRSGEVYDALEVPSALFSRSKGVAALWERMAVPRMEEGGRTLILQRTPDSWISRPSTRGEEGWHLELARCFPERGMILVELHRIRKHELDVVSKLCNGRVLLSFEVFLR